MTVNDRIKIAIRWMIGNGIASTQAGIGRLMGYTNKSAFSQVLNGHVDLPTDFIDRLCMLSEKLNSVWVKNGEGEMLTSSAAPQNGTATAVPAAAQADMVYIPREVWEVIRNQAASLKEKDVLLKEKAEMLKETVESFGRRDHQIDELIALLREEIEKGDAADYRGHAATRAAAD